MNNTSANIHLDGSIPLSISSNDKLAWKMAMLIEAASDTDKTIEKIANKYGYTREYFYQILKKYNEQGANGLIDKIKGPKRNYKRTNEITKQIIRHRFLDPEANCKVIAQKMQQAGLDISQRSVERTILDYGLQKKGYIKHLRKMKR